MRVLHPMQEIFTPESGANILRQLTFEQQETNVVQVRFYDALQVSKYNLCLQYFMWPWCSVSS